MNLKTRLKRIEKSATERHWSSIPWGALYKNPKGVEINGEFLTWEEVKAKYPEIPRPLRWADEIE